MDHDEYEGVNPSAQGEHFDAGEIATEQAAHMAVDELPPVARRLPTLAGAFAGVDAFALEDMLDAGGADLDAELPGLSQEAAVTPGYVFLGHADDGFGDALDRSLPAHPAGLLSGGFFPAPTAIGFWRGDQKAAVYLMVEQGPAAISLARSPFRT